jgi:hypothetical protein
MKQRNFGRYILSLVLVVGAVSSVGVDFNKTHIYNPAWPPHAVFHDLAMLNLLVCASIIALWLMWRKSTEPAIGLRAALLIVLSFWSAFFYATTLFPISSLRATPEEKIPVIAGFTIYPNAAWGFLFVIVALVGYRIGMGEIKKAKNTLA